MLRRSTGASIRRQRQTNHVSKSSQINTRRAQQSLKHARPRAKSNQLTAQAAVRVRRAVRLAAQELLGLELVLGLAIGTEGEELVVELARAPVPHADGAQRLEHVREVGSALRQAPVEDGGRDWKTCMAQPGVNTRSRVMKLSCIRGRWQGLEKMVRGQQSLITGSHTRFSQMRIRTLVGFGNILCPRQVLEQSRRLAVLCKKLDTESDENYDTAAMRIGTKSGALVGHGGLRPCLRFRRQTA